jgi:hypothetical protein
MSAAAADGCQVSDFVNGTRLYFSPFQWSVNDCGAEFVSVEELRER